MTHKLKNIIDINFLYLLMYFNHFGKLPGVGNLGEQPLDNRTILIDR